MSQIRKQAKKGRQKLELAFTSTSLRSRRSVLNLLQKYAAETFKKPFLLRKKTFVAICQKH